MSQQRTGRRFFIIIIIYRTTTFGYIHLIFLAAANHAAPQPTWSVPTSTGTNRCERSTLGFCSVYRLLDLNIKVNKQTNKNPCGHRCWWQRNLLHHPPPPRRGGGCPFAVQKGVSGECSSYRSSSTHICQAETIHTLRTKSNIYSSKLRTAFRRKTQINGAK